MDKKTMLELLEKDGCTLAEAEKHLKNGTIVYPDFIENFNEYMQEWKIEPDEIEVYKKMANDKIPVPDWGVVLYNGNYYFIQYCL